jgi:hypothetical protein
MKIIAIYPGRFQPFGKHHAEAFKWLQSQFGANNSYIVTSNVVSLPKSPLDFKDKKDIITQYGLGKHVVNVKNPYKAEELLSKFDPATTAVVFMVGQKDMEEDPRFKIGKLKSGKDSYFQDYSKNIKKLKGFDTHGYLVVAPHVSIKIPGFGEMSGTAIRNAIGSADTEAKRKELFSVVFGWYNSSLAKKLHDKFNMKAESIIESYMSSNNDFIEEGYMSTKQQKNHNAKLDKLKDFLDKNHGREFVYNFEEFPKTVYGVNIEEKVFWDNFFKLIMEGGAGGHMAHPFDIPSVTTGNDLINVFNQSIEYLGKKPASVKIDGVNASIRLVKLNNKLQFVMDRGSNKPLDVKGITKAELEDRFGSGHGMIKIGGTVLDIFNDSLSTCKPELKALGLLDNPNIMFNIEYVAGSTNVLSYGKNFLAIHGLLEIKQVTEKKRATSEISYNKSTMQKLLNKLNPIAQNYGYEVLGSIPTTLESQPDLNSELNKKYTVNYGPKKETKTLKQWLASAKVPRGNIKTVEGKSITALSKEVLLKISEGTPLNKFIADKKDYQDAIDGFVIYIATMKLGDAVLAKLNSPLGPVSEQEGIVIRDPKIYNKPFKITGKFIVGGLASSFKK